MKKVLFFAAVALLGLDSCSTKCPAYSSTKPANQVSSPITASAVAAPAARQ